MAGRIKRYLLVQVKHPPKLLEALGVDVRSSKDDLADRGSARLVFPVFQYSEKRPITHAVGNNVQRRQAQVFCNVRQIFLQMGC
ncbi:hypothetical protein D3C78_1656950 [compost metagenome]